MTMVFKFGGASIKDADAIRHLAPLIEQHKERPLIVVVSAMGKTTNKLEDLLAAARDKRQTDAYRECFEALQAEYREVTEALFGDAADSPAEQVNALFHELDEQHRKYHQDDYAKHYDQTVRHRHLISTTLAA